MTLRLLGHIELPAQSIRPAGFDHRRCSSAHGSASMSPHTSNDGDRRYRLLRRDRYIESIFRASRPWLVRSCPSAAQSRVFDQSRRRTLSRCLRPGDERETPSRITVGVVKPNGVAFDPVRGISDCWQNVGGPFDPGFVFRIGPWYLGRPAERDRRDQGFRVAPRWAIYDAAARNVLRQYHVPGHGSSTIERGTGEPDQGSAKGRSRVAGGK